MCSFEAQPQPSRVCLPRAGSKATLRRPDVRSVVISATPSTLLAIASTLSPLGERRTWSIDGAVPAKAAVVATAASRFGASPR